MDTKKLRQKILDLAIRGKLVPQDPNDELASVLLERIRAEKERLVKEGKIKRSKKSASDDEIEAPFEIPESWEWVRLKSLVSVLGDGIHGTPEYDITGGYYFINGNNLSNNKIVIKSDTKKVNEKEYQTYKKELNDKTILVSINGTIGNVGHYNNEPVILGKSACYYNLLDLSFKPYITMLMYTDYFLKYAVENATGSTIKNVSLAVMNDFLLPLPPLSEQQRIANEIERWFTLIDELESNEGDLLKAIDKAKSKILDLAIHGKLVPQDPNDEPASVLLDKIRAEKKQLFKEGKLKKKDLEETPISEDEKPFEIPESWEWVRWGTLSESIQYGYNTPAKEKGRIKMVRISDIQNGEIVWTTTPYCDIDEQDIDAYKLKKNDILFARTGGTVGKSYFVSEEPQEAIYAGYLIRTRYSCQLCPQYLKMFMDSSLYWEQLKDGTIATAQPNCNGQKLANMILPLPPLAEQKRIVAKIEEVFKEIDKLKK